MAKPKKAKVRVNRSVQPAPAPKPSGGPRWVKKAVNIAEKASKLMTKATEIEKKVAEKKGVSTVTSMELSVYVNAFAAKEAIEVGMEILPRDKREGWCATGISYPVYVLSDDEARKALESVMDSVCGKDDQKFLDALSIAVRSIRAKLNIEPDVIVLYEILAKAVTYAKIANDLSALAISSATTQNAPEPPYLEAALKLIAEAEKLIKEAEEIVDTM